MEKDRRAPARARAPRAAPQRARRQALIVDDEADFAQQVAGWFRSEGWAAEVADDGAQALALLAGRRMDLMIADLQMPGMNGWELLRHVRGRHSRSVEIRHPPTRIVVLSGCAEPDVCNFAQRLGADAFLSKPVARSTLFDTVAALFAPGQERAREAAAHRQRC